ncbi:hypothetical protein WA026_007002 [Henosepilachna vigintioctopunctata]|uniref:Uncharacterized protein n=1 Tax=Henosepilachna vigintioctopunctata TaxID=420089 RepID=A0AAW1V3G6_9CUCU
MIMSPDSSVHSTPIGQVPESTTEILTDVSNIHPREPVLNLEFDGTTVLCRVCGDKASGFITEYTHVKDVRVSSDAASNKRYNTGRARKISNVPYLGLIEIDASIAD